MKIKIKNFIEVKEFVHLKNKFLVGSKMKIHFFSVKDPSCLGFSWDLLQFSTCFTQIKLVCSVSSLIIMIIPYNRDLRDLTIFFVFNDIVFHLKNKTKNMKIRDFHQLFCILTVRIHTRELPPTDFEFLTSSFG